MIIGIDIGGSKIKGVLWNGKKVLKHFEFVTPKTLKNFEKIVFGLVKSFSSEIKVGVGVAGVIKNNTIVSTTNIKYLKKFDFSLLSPADGGTKLRIDNDARCFARAEYNIGVGWGVKSMLMVTLGTGIGRAYVKNSKILKIKRFEYAENWEKDYQKIKDKNKLAKFVSEKLAPIIYTLDPKIVVLGGGVVGKKGYYNAISHKLYAISKDNKGIRHTAYSIRRSRLGKFAGAIGAAMLWTSKG